MFGNKCDLCKEKSELTSQQIVNRSTSIANIVSSKGIEVLSAVKDTKDYVERNDKTWTILNETKKVLEETANRLCPDELSKELVSELAWHYNCVIQEIVKSIPCKKSSTKPKIAFGEKIFVNKNKFYIVGERFFNQYTHEYCYSVFEKGNRERLSISEKELLKLKKD